MVRPGMGWIRVTALGSKEAEEDDWSAVYRTDLTVTVLRRPSSPPSLRYNSDIPPLPQSLAAMRDKELTIRRL